MATPISSAMRAAPPARVLFVVRFAGVDMGTKSPDDMSDISLRQGRNGRRASFWEEAQMGILRRRTVLGGALGAPFAMLAAPSVHAQGGKPHAGTTINGSCFQTTYFEYLKAYFPQFEEKTGIK